MTALSIAIAAVALLLALGSFVFHAWALTSFREEMKRGIAAAVSAELGEIEEELQSWLNSMNQRIDTQSRRLDTERDERLKLRDSVRDSIRPAPVGTEYPFKKNRKDL